MFRFTVFCLCVTSIWALPSSVKHPKHSPQKHPSHRIINGHEAKDGQFPWQVGIYIDANDGYWFCGGSIIGEEWILTAGHCVDGAMEAQIVSGTLNSAQGYITNASQFILHPEYDEAASANDIGLIMLLSPLTFDENTAPIDLATEELEYGADVTVCGWGTTSDSSGSSSSTLNYVDLVTIPASVCEVYYAIGAILPEMICANSSTAEEVRGTCLGDSGGPLMVDLDSNPLHVGIVSFVSNQGCESGYPSGYMRTAYYRDWIRKNTGV